MKIFILLTALFPLVIFAEPSDLPAKRLPDETFQQAVDRVNAALPKDEASALVFKKTPYGQRTRLNKINYSSVPAVITYGELMAMFRTVRDTRFLHAQEMPYFPRRISWLYPDDGCFARAAMARLHLDREQLTQPGKIYAFGSLMVSTPFSESGYVTWWYHVAAAVTYMGSVYVIDPALDAKGPMLAEDWFAAMGDSNEMTGSVCNAYSYNPSDDCNASRSQNARALRDQLHYLESEWTRVSVLGFDPFDILGINPPWLVALKG